MNPHPYSSEESPAQLREYLRVLRRRKWSILLLTALAAGGALLYSLHATTKYASTTKVLLKPPVSNQLNPELRVETAVDAGTQQQIVHSTAVAQMVAQGLGLPPSEAPSLLARLSVAVPLNTQILTITYTSPKPAEAQARSQAFADDYLSLETTQAQADLNRVRTGLEQRLAKLNAQLSRSNRVLATAPNGSVEQTTAQSNHDLWASQIAVLGNQLASLLLLNVDPGDVIQPAALPTSPVSPNYPLNVGLGIFAGLALGIGVAFVREHVDDRINDRADLEGLIAAPALAVIPKFKGRRKKKPRLVAVSEPGSEASEAYRVLRASAQYASSENGLKSILVTSPLAGEGKTTTAANLAALLAAAGKNVVVVSADFRRPRIHEFFKLSDQHGLADALNGSGSAWTYVQDSGLKGLRFLGSGRPAERIELLESGKMPGIIAELGTKADFVLIDSAPMLTVADTLSLARLVDGVLLVAGSHSTTREALTLAKEKLEGASATMFGVVLNNFDTNNAGGEL